MPVSKHCHRRRRANSHFAQKNRKHGAAANSAVSKLYSARACSTAVTYVMAHTALKIPNHTQQLLILTRRREVAKKRRRAQMARNFAQKHRKGKQRRPVSWSRANRHVYTNKDMKM